MKSIVFYKPNPRNSGCAASLSCGVNTRNQKIEFYLNMVKQVSWNAAERKGSFKSEDPNNKIALKFNITELGSLCYTIATGNDFSTVHRSESGMTSIKFAPYMKGDKRAFGLSVSRNKNKFSIGFEENEAVVIDEFCRQSIRDISCDNWQSE
jgi:hypothetical protein